MTTKKEKKGVKKAKSAKSGSRPTKTVKPSGTGAVREKMVAKTAKVSEVDKEKMAAFFSAAGLKDVNPEVKPDAGTPARTAAPLPDAKVVAETKPETPVQETEKPVVKTPEPEVAVAKPQPEKDILEPETENLKAEKGEIEMTPNKTVSSNTKESKSGSFSTLPMFVILLCLAAFWFYYISAAPQPETAAVQVKKSQTKIQSLEAQVKVLQAKVAALQASLAALQKPAAEVKVKESAAKPAVKDSSFDKAPIPFWRTMHRNHTEQLQKASPKPVLKAAPVKSEKVDSFSKAPVPFWRKAPADKNGVKVEKDLAADKNHDSSFDKAPIPFWEK